MNSKLLDFIKYIKYNKEIKVLSLFAKGNIIVYLVVYIQSYLINSTLNVTDLGKFSYYQSILTVVLSVLSFTIFGSHLRFLGFVDTAKLNKFIKRILFFATFAYSIIVLLIWKNWYFLPLSAFIWYNEELYFFRSIVKIKLYTGMKFVQCLITIVMFIFVFINGKMNYEKLILIIGISYLLTYLLFRPLKLTSVVICYDEEEFNKKEILKYSLPGAISILSLYLLASADQIFIKSYLMSLDLSNYAMALRTLAVIQLFTSVFMDYWPRFYFEKAKSKMYSEIKKMSFLFKISIFLFSILCIVFASPIYTIMGAKKYIGQSTLIFTVLVFSEIFRVFGSINMTYRSFTKESIYNVTILSILGIVKLFLNFMFIEKYGLFILLSTTLFSYILYWLISIIISVKQEKKYMETPASIF